MIDMYDLLYYESFGFFPKDYEEQKKEFCKSYKERQPMTEQLHPLDKLVNTLREEWQKLCNYTTDLDHDVTGLYEPGGSIADVKHTLWRINECYFRAFLAVNRYEEKMKEQHE